MVRMLVAVDGSPRAKKAAELAARFARELREADATLVNVGHIPTIALGGPGETMIDLGGLFLGSVSERVLHAAHIPVLIAR